MFDLYKLQHFVAVAQAGSFVRASQELSLSQPALSRSVQSLERQVGAKLLDRGKAGVTLTAVGEAFYAQAQDLLFRADNLEHNMNAVLKGTKGELRFGIGPASASAFLPRLLETLHDRYPDVAAYIAIASVEQMRESLLEGDLEFFIARDRGGETVDSRIAAREFATANPVFLVRHGHPLLAQPEVKQSDLLRYRLASGTAWNETLRESAPQDAHALAATIELDNYELLAHLTAKSDTVLIASMSLLRSDLEPLSISPADLGVPASRVSVFTLDGRTLSPVAQVVQKMLRHQFTRRSLDDLHP